MASHELKVQEALNRVRDSMDAYGVRSIRAVARAFKVVDFNGNKKLDSEEFDEVLRKSGVFVDRHIQNLIMREFDLDGDGSINYEEFLQGLRKGSFTEPRRAITELAFDVMDRDGSGQITIGDLRGIYNGSAHPDVLAGKKTEDQILTEFLDGFDGMQGNDDGVVTKEEFLSYYEDVSASIPTDAYFVAMVESAYMITAAPLDEDLKRMISNIEDSMRVKALQHSHGSEDEQHTLERLFRFYDGDHSGRLTVDEFAEALSNMGIAVDRKYIRALFDRFDHDGSGNIEYREFAAHVFRTT